MARNNNKMSRVRNIEPAVLTQTFTLDNPYFEPAVPTVFYYYIDINQINSLTNRRFYRQGLNTAIAGFKFVSANTGSIQINNLPNTWVMANAWMKGFSSWQRMNAQSLIENESVRPRFLDFKIYMNSKHHKNGFAANQIPVSSEQAVNIAGQWEPSKIHVPIGDGATPSATFERELVAVGSNYPGAGASGLDAVSLIEGYAASRGLPNVLDPNTPDDAADAAGNTPANWIAALSNEGTDRTEEVLEDMTLENNIAPYPFENDGVNADTMYPGGANQFEGLAIHDLVLATSSTIGGTTRLKGGNFPCGLIELVWRPTDGVSGFPALLIDMIPGSHRGLLAEPMQEM